MANTDWRKHVLTNGKEIKLCMTKDEIYASYRDANSKGNQIGVLADLNSTSQADMALYLSELGFDNSYLRQRVERAAKNGAAPKKQKANKPKGESNPSLKDKSVAAEATDSINVPPKIKNIVREKPTTRAKLLNDTLELIGRCEDEYRYCCLLIESIDVRKNKLKQTIDALAVAYHNIEEIAKSDK